MSIANEVHGVKLQNPAQKFIKFKNGEFVYYDKEKQENIKIDMPINFILLEVLSTITGYHDKSESGIYSNEIRNISDDILKVKAFKGGDIAEGLYSKISDTIKAQGGRFTASVYGILNDELVNFQFVGAALSSWINSRNETRNAIGYKVAKLEEGKKGATTYKFPIFEPILISDEEKEKAIKVYNDVLDPYLNEYTKKSVREANSILVDDEIEDIDDRIFDDVPPLPPLPNSPTDGQ